MSAGESGDNWSILLVDPCPVIGSGLQDMLDGSPFGLAERIDNFPDARRYLTNQVIDLVMADFIFAGGNLQNLWDVCCREQVPLLLFSSFRHPEYVARAARLGVCGLVDKRSGPDAVLSALRQVRAGETIWSRQQIRQANAAMVDKSLVAKIEFPLTRRELQVLRLLADGNSNRIIADRLGIGFETAKEHVQHLLAKLAVNDRTQAAVMAERHGLL